jgi:hypothetical protein
MKEIRTIKMVEQTEVKFVADDGKEFVGENAERECRDYERTRDEEKVKQAFERLDAVKLNMPFISWFSDDYEFWRVVLNSKSDFVAMMDYFNVVWRVYDNDIKEPSAYGERQRSASCPIGFVALPHIFATLGRSYRDYLGT